MVGEFGRPRDQDERDGEEEYDHHHHHHHHHQRCGRQVKVWWSWPGGTRVGREEGAGGQCCWALQRRRFACKQRDMTTSALQLSALHPTFKVKSLSVLYLYRQQGPGDRHKSVRSSAAHITRVASYTWDCILHILLQLKPGLVKIII